jgi:hypothetical protein
MKINILFISACLLFLASACSVNKRAHRPGYNVEWHSANPKPKNHPKLEGQERAMDLPLELTTEEAYAETLQEPQSIEQSAASELLEEDNTIAGAERSTGILEHVFKIGKSNIVDSQIDKPESEPREEAPQQRNSKADNLAIWGFVISIASIAALPLASVASYYAISVLAGILVSISIFGPLAAIILCAIALRKMRKNPTEHRKRGLAKAGLIIGILVFVFWILGFILSGFVS